MSISKDVITFVNIVSGLTFFLTAILYSKVPAVKNVQGKCIFHYSCNAGVAHLTAMIILITNESKKRFCIDDYSVAIFFFIISLFWMHALSFHTWRTFRHKIQDKSHMVWYYAFGYGLPLSMILAITIELYFIDRRENGCYSLVQTQGMHLAAPFTLTIVSIPIFYFLDVRYRALKMLKNNQNSSSLMKKIKYRYLLYLKLSVLMGLPWLVIMFFLSIHFVFIWLLTVDFIVDILIFLTSSEGIAFFIVMVLLRKKMMRYIVERGYCGCKVFSKYFRNVDESEAEDIDDDNIEYKVADVEPTTVEMKTIAPVII